MNYERQVKVREGSLSKQTVNVSHISKQNVQITIRGDERLREMMVYFGDLKANRGQYIYCHQLCSRRTVAAAPYRLGPTHHVVCTKC